MTTNKTTNPKIIIQKGLPLKIFYLKQSRSKKIDDDQKPTLAYLSAFIQDQKGNFYYNRNHNNYIKNNNNNNQINNYNINTRKTTRDHIEQNQKDDNDKQFYKTPRIYKTANQRNQNQRKIQNLSNIEHVTNYQKQKQKQKQNILNQDNNFILKNKMIKNKTQYHHKRHHSDYQDPNSLSKLLGKDWRVMNQQLSKPNVKNKKVQNDILPNYQSIKQKIYENQKNSKLFKKDFQVFLRNKSKQSQLNAKKSLNKDYNLKSIVTVNPNDVNNNQKKISVELNFDNSQEIQLSVRNIFEQKKLAENKIKNKNKRNISLEASIIHRMNFKQINNFNWSKIQENNSEFMFSKVPA